MSAINSQPLSTRLILCEKSGRWAAWLRRLASEEAHWIVETRSLPQLTRELGEHPASLCGIELTAKNAAQAAETVVRIRNEFPASCIIALCDRQTAHIVWQICEVGAAAVIASPRQVEPVLQIWRRHCRQHPPREETNLDRVLTHLPW